MIWNSFESVIAQALVTVHHILLQTFLGTDFHGLFASSISIIYTFIPILNFGFDYSLSSSLQNFTQNKKNLLSLLLFQFLPQLIVIYLIAHFITQPFFYNKFFSSLVTPEIVFWLKYLFIIEYIRKSLRSFLQLMLHTKVTAITEIIGTIFYMAAFWILLFLFKINMTITIALKLLTLSVFIQTIILSIHLIKIFLSLTDSMSSSSNNSLALAHHSLNKNRIGIWTNHLFSQLNYSNFVIPFSNACFGPAQASVLTILINSARCVKLFFQKGLGVSSLALFSQQTEHSDISNDKKYSYPLYYLYNFSVPLFIFFLINSSKLSYFLSSNQLVWHLAPIACFLSIIEGAISVYEKFYIAEKLIYLFSAINSIGSIILFIFVYKFLIFNNLIQFFLFFFLVRMFALIIIAGLAHYFFKLPSPIFSLNIYAVGASTILSVLFYLFF